MEMIDNLGFAVVHGCCQQQYTTNLTLTIRTSTGLQVYSVPLHESCLYYAACYYILLIWYQLFTVDMLQLALRCAVGDITSRPVL